MGESKEIEDFHVRIYDQETKQKLEDLKEIYEKHSGNYSNQGTMVMLIHVAHRYLEKLEDLKNTFDYGSQF